MWQIVDMKVSDRRNPIRDQRRIHKLSWQVRESMHADRRNLAETSVKAIASLLTSYPLLVRKD